MSDTKGKKPKVRVHNPTNSETRYSRNYNYFFDVFTNYLKKFFTVEENRYYKHAHKDKLKVDLINGLSNNFYVGECEYIIENFKTGEFVVLTVSDYPLTHAVLNEYRENNACFKKALISQYNPTIIEGHITTDKDKVEPWYYFQTDFVNLDVLYEKRKHIKTKLEKIYFKGSTSYRSFLDHISSDIITDNNTISPTENYLNDLINYKLGLSIDGVGEFCYRDVELMGIGVPMLRYEFLSKMNTPLVPNFHYISVDRPNDLPLYRDGTKVHADKLIERYREVIGDKEFLEFISKNARQYFDDNLKYENLIPKTFQLLKLDDWI